MSNDAFIHLPHLRGRLTPAEESELRVTPERMALWDQRALELGRPPNWRTPDQELEASRLALLGRFESGEDLWIYSYGSLMWDPGFHFAEVRLAELAGYQRRFSYRATMGRGSPEKPGLMLTLEECAGNCAGLVYRIACDVAPNESAVVWRREMLRGGYCPRMLGVSTPQGEVTALVFTANTSHVDHVGELPLDETAAMIASGSGILGTSRQYLDQMKLQLESLGIVDPYVCRLAERVQGIYG